MKDIVEFATEVLGIELLDYQKEILRKVELGEDIKFSLYPKRGTPKWVHDTWDEYRQFQKMIVGDEQ